MRVSGTALADGSPYPIHVYRLQDDRRAPMRPLGQGTSKSLLLLYTLHAPRGPQTALTDPLDGMLPLLVRAARYCAPLKGARSIAHAHDYRRGSKRLV